jgi:NAD(P)-dependent dehydrogenase (short-subunit alcohol dehydrogenase family)
MKILLVGGTGTIGSAVSKELNGRHDIILAASKSGDIQVDITSRDSIESMFKNLPPLDAVVVTVGGVHFGPFETMTEDDFLMGITSKLMGQVNIVLQGQKYLNRNGSFTLTSGVLSQDPIRFGSNASTVNGAIDSFVKSAAIELLPKSYRINAVSPTVVLESMKEYSSFFSGFSPVSVNQVALSYLKSIEGAQTGQVYCVG